MNDLKETAKSGQSHPGEFIAKEVIEPLDLSISAAARILGVRRHELRDIIDGKVALSTRMALRIEMAFGTPMETLLGLQMECDIAQARGRKEEIAVVRYEPDRQPGKDPAADDAGPGVDMASVDFLPLCARVAIERLEAAWEWATHSDDLECRYAVWSIARHHERGHTDTAFVRGIIMRHLSIISALFDEREARGQLTTPGPDLSGFDCAITRAAMETGHPDMHILAYRVRRARAELPDTLDHEARENLHAYISRTLKEISTLKPGIESDVPPMEACPWPVPALSTLLSREEQVYRAALAWAGAEPDDSDAHALARKIRIRTDSLCAKKRMGPLARNRDNKNYYIYGSGTLYVWYRKLARLYLDSLDQA